MIPSVEECYDFAAFLLGDIRKKVFTSDKIALGFNSAWAEMFDHFKLADYTVIEAVAPYTLAPGQTEATPALFGISNLGGIVRLEERASGSGNRYTDVELKGRLGQRDPGAALLEWENRGGKLNFIGATQSIDLRLTYYLSGDPPTTGTTGIDNCKNFLAYRTAAIIGPPSGFDPAMAERYDVDARGTALDGRGGHLHRMLLDVVKRKPPIQLPDYDHDTQVQTWPQGRPPIFITDY